MKNRISQIPITLAITAILLAALVTCLAEPAGAAPGEKAAVTTQAPASTAAPTATAEAPAEIKLPYGVEDVLKLSRAQVNEEVIVTYVQTSGTIYNLGSKDIVYLHNQGVSDRVITSMLGQRKKTMESTAQQPAPTAPNQPAYQDNGTAVATTAPLTPTYAQPASSVYVMPYPATSYAYYGYPYYYSSYYPRYYYGGCYGYPYYGGYYGGYRGCYYGPSVGFSFNFGGHGHSGGGIHVHRR